MSERAGRHRAVMTVDLGERHAAMLTELVRRARMDGRIGVLPAGLTATRSDVIRWALEAYGGGGGGPEVDRENLAAFFEGAIEEWWRGQGGDTKKGRRTNRQRDKAMAAALANCACRMFRVVMRRVPEEGDNDGSRTKESGTGDAADYGYGPAGGD